MLSSLTFTASITNTVKRGVNKREFGSQYKTNKNIRSFLESYISVGEHIQVSASNRWKHIAVIAKNKSINYNITSHGNIIL